MICYKEKVPKHTKLQVSLKFGPVIADIETMTVFVKLIVEYFFYWWISLIGILFFQCDKIGFRILNSKVYIIPINYKNVYNNCKDESVHHGPWLYADWVIVILEFNLMFSPFGYATNKTFKFSPLNRLKIGQTQLILASFFLLQLVEWKCVLVKKWSVSLLCIWIIAFAASRGWNEIAEYDHNGKLNIWQRQKLLEILSLNWSKTYEDWR